MVSSTPPFAEPDWHPVHRANAMLRAALLAPAQPASIADEEQELDTLSHAITSVLQGPVNITFPQPLTARLDALTEGEAEDESFSSLASFETVFRAPAIDVGLEDWETDGDAEDDEGIVEAEEASAEIAQDAGRHLITPQFHMQDLMQEFERRQRRATLLVAGSIATAALLTLGGLFLIAGLAAPLAASGENNHLARSTSVAWQRPAEDVAAAFSLAAMSANRAAKGEPLFMPALGASPTALGTPQVAPQLILAATGRRVALAPLLPPSQSGYLLIRGLPAAATLSAGRQSESGTWLVKAEHVPNLTLSVGNAAEGDYPLEVYLLQSGDGPQGRRSLVLRIEGATPVYPLVASDWDWTSALLNVVPAAHAAETATVPAQPAVLRERAQRLLEEGDIAAARLLLQHLAESGEGKAAYELARTFDPEILSTLGAKGIDADDARARRWYERASQGGNAEATERLRILASLPGADPSD